MEAGLQGATEGIMTKPLNSDFDVDWPSVPDPECPSCGAASWEPCAWDCDCEHCQRARAKEDRAKKGDAA